MLKLSKLVAHAKGVWCVDSRGQIYTLLKSGIVTARNRKTGYTYIDINQCHHEGKTFFETAFPNRRYITHRELKQLFDEKTAITIETKNIRLSVCKEVKPKPVKHILSGNFVVLEYNIGFDTMEEVEQWMMLNIDIPTCTVYERKTVISRGLVKS